MALFAASSSKDILPIQQSAAASSSNNNTHLPIIIIKTKDGSVSIEPHVYADPLNKSNLKGDLAKTINNSQIYPSESAAKKSDSTNLLQIIAQLLIEDISEKTHTIDLRECSSKAINSLVELMQAERLAMKNDAECKIGYQHKRYSTCIETEKAEFLLRHKAKKMKIP